MRSTDVLRITALNLNHLALSLIGWVKDAYNVLLQMESDNRV